MEWNGAAFFLIAFSGRLSDQRTDRALRFAFGSLPIKPIVLSFVAQEFLRVLFRVVLIVCGAGVFLLCIHCGSKGVYREVFVAADSAEQDFLFSFSCVEEPDVVL